METMQQYVILPPRGLRAKAGTLSSKTEEALRAMRPSAQPAGRGGPQVATADADRTMQVLGSLAEDGAKLVAASREHLRALRVEHPELRVAPVVYYRLERAERPEPQPRPTLAAATLAVAATVNVRVVDADTGDPVEFADVRAFTDLDKLYGASGLTDASGWVRLDFGSPTANVERIYVYPPLAGYWGTYAEQLVLTGGETFALAPIDLSTDDSRRIFLGHGSDTDGNGVRVAVVDTGVGPHPDLISAGDVDNGDGHGTHVAGVIAARGRLPGGLVGLAPASEIYSYRVFDGHGLAANFDVAAAIDQAINDGCDLVNLSLGYDHGSDPVVDSAIEDAYDQGILCLAAAGNAGRQPVEFPANHARTIAVSALGQQGSFPPDSIDELDIFGPFGTDARDFIAAFSNVGHEIDVTAPGVGVISTVPDDGYGWMSGTSMACPVVTGIAACLLARNPSILGMPRDAGRASAIAGLVFAATRSLGFPANLEGLGLPEC